MLAIGCRAYDITMFQFNCHASSRLYSCQQASMDIFKGCVPVSYCVQGDLGFCLLFRLGWCLDVARICIFLQLLGLKTECAEFKPEENSETPGNPPIPFHCRSLPFSKSSRCWECDFAVMQMVSCLL